MSCCLKHLSCHSSFAADVMACIYLQEGLRTMVGIATFDSTIHFYNLKRALQQVSNYLITCFLFCGDKAKFLICLSWSFIKDMHFVGLMENVIFILNLFIMMNAYFLFYFSSIWVYKLALVLLIHAEQNEKDPFLVVVGIGKE